MRKLQSTLKLQSRSGGKSDVFPQTVAVQMGNGRRMIHSTQFKALRSYTAGTQSNTQYTLVAGMVGRIREALVFHHKPKYVSPNDDMPAERHRYTGTTPYWQSGQNVVEGGGGD